MLNAHSAQEYVLMSSPSPLNNLIRCLTLPGGNMFLLGPILMFFPTHLSFLCAPSPVPRILQWDMIIIFVTALNLF